MNPITNLLTIKYINILYNINKLNVYKLFVGSY